MEIEDDVLGLDRYRRIRRMIDVSKPLCRYQWMKDRKGNEVKIEYKYERLPYFCLACGICGHSKRDCVNVSEEDKKKRLGWGLSLRASPPKGHARDFEELAQITSGRQQLFVTKEKDTNAPRLVEGVIKERVGGEDVVEGSKNMRDKAEIEGLDGIVRKVVIMDDVVGKVGELMLKMGGEAVGGNVSDIVNEGELLDQRRVGEEYVREVGAFNMGHGTNPTVRKFKRVKKSGIEVVVNRGSDEKEFKCYKI